MVVGNAYVDDFLTVTVRELLIDSVDGHIITETGEGMNIIAGAAVVNKVQKSDKIW